MVILPLDAGEQHRTRSTHLRVRDAQTLCGKLSHARFWRVFASLSGLCLGQSWLGQSPQRCACVAGWNVCTTRGKDFIRVADLGGDDLDDCLGVARIYFCALRNVETSSRQDCEPRSARPKIATLHSIIATARTPPAGRCRPAGPGADQDRRAAAKLRPPPPSSATVGARRGSRRAQICMNRTAGPVTLYIAASSGETVLRPGTEPRHSSIVLASRSGLSA